MTFEKFDDLRLWADTLQDSLVSPKSSCLHFHSSSIIPSEASDGEALNAAASQKSCSTRALSTRSSNHQTHFSNLFSRAIHHCGGNNDGFLHVTLDRLLFVTTSQGRKPALLAFWNFTNGEISVYGTGRACMKTDDLETKVFYLVDGKGQYIFICDRAVELSAWIQRATRPASYLYERRWLSSVAAQLGEDQKLVVMPLSGGSGREVCGASLGEVDEIPVTSSQKTPYFPVFRPNPSSSMDVDVHLPEKPFGNNFSSSSFTFRRHVRGRQVIYYFFVSKFRSGSYRARMRFSSNPTDRPVQPNALQASCQYASASVPSTHDANVVSRWDSEILSCPCQCSRTDDQPSMVALSPLPLESPDTMKYFPLTSVDCPLDCGNPGRVEKEDRVRTLSAALSSPDSSCANPRPECDGKTEAEVRPARWASRPRQLGNRSTSLTLSNHPSASPFSRGAGSTRYRAASLSPSSILGVTCSVPWDAAPTNEKPRTGCLYSSRDEIREAALRAATTLPASSQLTSLPSAKYSSGLSSDESDARVDASDQRLTHLGVPGCHSFYDARISRSANYLGYTPYVPISWRRNHTMNDQVEMTDRSGGNVLSLNEENAGNAFQEVSSPEPPLSRSPDSPLVSLGLLPSSIDKADGSKLMSTHHKGRQIGVLIDSRFNTGRRDIVTDVSAAFVVVLNHHQEIRNSSAGGTGQLSLFSVTVFH
ncbi:unnamed protein product [Mesocestoides corti]|uniref:Uncharacterized protein n=1 Tax=Mesocestoides corti TaxID=53468 RepID=A0A0R3U6S7_MESCO|nr:unnamed protein product [Mesocestoides corti]